MKGATRYTSSNVARSNTRSGYILIITIQFEFAPSDTGVREIKMGKKNVLFYYRCVIVRENLKLSASGNGKLNTKILKVPTFYFLLAPNIIFVISSIVSVNTTGFFSKDNRVTIKYVISTRFGIA